MLRADHIMFDDAQDALPKLLLSVIRFEFCLVIVLHMQYMLSFPVINPGINYCVTVIMSLEVFQITIPPASLPSKQIPSTLTLLVFNFNLSNKSHSISFSPPCTLSR